MKKIIIVIVAVAVIGAAAFYFIVMREETEKPVVLLEYSPGEFFTTNVHGVSRILKVAVSLVVTESRGILEKLEEDNSRIRDTIIFILRDLTEEEILALGKQDPLRERIIEELNERLGIDNIVEVLFTDFVMA